MVLVCGVWFFVSRISPLPQRASCLVLAYTQRAVVASQTQTDRGKAGSQEGIGAMGKKAELPDKSADTGGQLFERLLRDEVTFQQKRRISFLQSLVDAKVTSGSIASHPGVRGIPFPVINDIANDLRDFERNQQLRPCWLWNKTW